MIILSISQLQISERWRIKGTKNKGLVSCYEVAQVNSFASLHKLLLLTIIFGSMGKIGTSSNCTKQSTVAGELTAFSSLN